MTFYIIRRSLQAVIVLFIVSLLIFFVMRLLPSDPLAVYIAQNQLDNLTPEGLEGLRVKFGLDKSYPMQYLGWLADLVRGDFGTSITYQDEVGTLLFERLPVTAYLGILSLTLSSLLGIAFGIICAIRRGKSIDTFVTSLANIGVSIPIFWLGILMIYILGLKLRWLPIQGFTSPFDDTWMSLKQLVMPVLCEATVALSVNTRLTRSSMLEVIRQDYIRTAWAKGLNERVIILRHVIRNGIIPVITVIGMQTSLIIGGSVFIESVFNIPGMGRLIVNAVISQDYPIVQGGCFIIAIMVVFINLLVDISYGWINPRVQYD